MRSAQVRFAVALILGIAMFALVGRAQAPTPSPAATESADRLIGIWKATLRTGAETHGPLVVQRTAGAYSADLLGRRLPVLLDKGELSFNLPNGNGSFRGKLQPDGAIHGYWFVPSVFYKAATFVELKPDGVNRWLGEIDQRGDSLTFYLSVQKQPDGSLGAFLRNPERNIGLQLDVDHIVRQANVVKLLGVAAAQQPEKIISTGNYDPDNDVISLPIRGGNFEFAREGDESNFYPRGKNPERYVYSIPLARDDGWPVATVDEVGIDRAGVEKFIQRLIDMPMESVRTPVVDGFLIARHGKLVLEEYFHGEHRDKLHNTRSASKSVNATIIGAAMHDGAPLKLSTPVYQMMNGGTFPADLEPRKRAMTLEHLLTMSSGFFCDDGNPKAPGREDAMIDQDKEPDFYRFTLRVPMATDPGEKAVYCSANPNLALGVLSQATGEAPLYTFDRLLGTPMKVKNYVWPMDHAGHFYGGGGTAFLPRDFMKFGQLMLNGGIWQGRRLLSQEFVTRASSRLYHLASIYYGYLWWNLDFPYKDRTVQAFYAGGNGGQGVVVIPELDLVVATYGENYNDFRATVHITQELVPRYILPAVREAGDDKNAPVVEREFVTPYRRSENTGPVLPKP